MSEHMPEVGDLWIYEDNDYKRITYISLFEYGLVFGVNDDGRVLWGSNMEYFLKKNKYLGKSKANINQLFEVQNGHCNTTPSNIHKSTNGRMAKIN